MKEKINKTSVDALIAGRYPGESIIADAEIIGFTARLLRSGTVTFIYRYRNEKGDRKEQPLGVYGKVTPDQARIEAKKAQGKVAGGTDIVEVRKETRRRDGMTVDTLLDQHVELYVKALASSNEIIRLFDKYVRPVIGEIVIYDLTRSDVIKMLDKVPGDSQADHVLAAVRKAFNWHAVRDEKFRTPLVKGMARTKPLERARDRILDEDEIADLWQALDELVEEGSLHLRARAAIHTLMFTTMRLTQITEMPRAEIRGRNWLIPKERNRKTKVDHWVYLTDAALEAIGEGRGKYVFSTDDGETAIWLGDKIKSAIDDKIAEIRKDDDRPAMRHWTWHDLRRTGRSLMSGMSDQGVTPDHAERVLGHLLPGIRRTYDVYGYKREKQRALECLAARIADITRPRGGNVVRLKKSA